MEQIPFITVEVGGSNPTQFHLPSSDILADLQQTLFDNGLRDRAMIIGAVAMTTNLYEGKIDFLEKPKSIFGYYIRMAGWIETLGTPRLLPPGAIVVFDDYVCFDENIKQAPVQKWSCKYGPVEKAARVRRIPMGNMVWSKSWLTGLTLILFIVFECRHDRELNAASLYSLRDNGLKY